MTSSARAPSGVLFDLDGTLIDSYRLYLEAYRRALAPYVGRLPDREEIAAQRPSSEKHFLVQWLGHEKGVECHAAMCTAYEDLHRAYCNGIYEGVPEMLAALRTAGVPIGIVTGKGRRAWEVTERELGLGPFAVVITEDEVEFPKPDPGGLRAALEIINVKPGEAVYVGDSVSDAAAARAAGLLVGAALWPKDGPGERDAFLQEIAEYEPDWAFERPADVTRLLTAWC
ncbi:MAG: HAD family hydrolase [Gemmatimonadetes bacterium]|nr:HAD family hydrolase [Gemmatimonadota bacterium]